MISGRRGLVTRDCSGSTFVGYPVELPELIQDHAVRQDKAVEGRSSLASRLVVWRHELNRLISSYALLSLATILDERTSLTSTCV
jgi:hypothetical protein